MNHSVSATSFGAFTKAMFHVEVFWVETPFSAVVGYQRFNDPRHQKTEDPEDGGNMALRNSSILPQHYMAS